MHETPVKAGVFCFSDFPSFSLELNGIDWNQPLIFPQFIHLELTAIHYVRINFIRCQPLQKPFAQKQI